MAMTRGGWQARVGRGSRGLQRAGLLGVALLWSLPVWALHWPWHHHHAASARGPQPVQAVAVSVQSPGATASRSPVAQYWDGNTLLLDLTHLGASGEATLLPYANVGWPVRLEFRVRPGGMQRLDVQGAQRMVFFVPAHGNEQLLRLDPSIYASDTARISLRWSAAGGSAP